MIINDDDDDDDNDNDDNDYDNDNYDNNNKILSIYIVPNHNVHQCCT